MKDAAQVKKQIAVIREELRTYRREVTQVEASLLKNTQLLKAILEAIAKEQENGRKQIQARVNSEGEGSTDAETCEERTHR